MTRQARQISNTGIYHVVFRGVNKCLLFEEDADYRKILALFENCKENIPFSLYAYCLMGNHVHLLLREQNPSDISSIMQKVLTQYAGWFNRKYARSGALIANRYKSSPVENDQYITALVRYIHQNPVRAGMAEKPEDYPWSSYRAYLGDEGISDTSFVLGIFSSDRASAMEEFREFHKVNADEDDFVIAKGRGRPDTQIRREATRILGTGPISVAALPKQERNGALATLRENGYSIRQIERITGVSRGVVAKC